VLRVTHEFHKKKAPVYKERQKAIAKVPEFWFRVLLAHPYTGENISDLDQGALFYLTSLEVHEIDGTQQDYRIELVS
jgi:hypothetical protein